VTSKIPNNEIANLTFTEMQAIVDKINSDPNASIEIKNNVAQGTMQGPIRVNNAIIKYLDTVTKK